MINLQPIFTNQSAIEEHDIQTGDFVEVRRMGGNIIICVTDILKSGVICGEDEEGWQWQEPASRVVENLRQ